MRWVPSRFNAHTTAENGDLVIYNSYRGTFMMLPARLRNAVRAVLRREGALISTEPRGILKHLADGGFLIPAGTDEHRRARFLHEVEGRRTDSLNLILMPNENCNFRCVYCYETFARDKMEPQIIEGVKNLVRARARRLEQLVVSWFGGEPLTALDVMGDLSEFFIELCNQHGTSYSSSVTTNGYNLTPLVAQDLLRWQVRTFQITLDGEAASHDQRRILLGGGGTFERIYQNLLDLRRQSEESLRVLVRINVDSDNVPSARNLVGLLQRDFGDDPRFAIHFHPITRLGGTNDGGLPVLCTSTPIWDLWEQVVDLGLPIHDLTRSMMPHGSACYAANPSSYVIGADGRVYKCTVAFSDPRNHVGWLRPDGRMDLDLDKMALWVTSDEMEDTACQSCFFRPSCQGNACPLDRMDTGKPPCPDVKTHIRRALRIVGRARRVHTG